MTEELFRADSYAQSCEAAVTAAGPEGIVLDRTVFYPVGGGQPGDTGVLRWDGGTCRVVDTVKDRDSGRLLHIPEEGAALPTAGAQVTAEVDWDRRHRHMRMHTCLHLLCSLIDAPVTGGNLSDEKGRLDFDMEDSPDKEALTERLNALVAADHPVAASWISGEELQANPDIVRTMSVKPPITPDGVRVIRIEGVDFQPCGGTHVRSTGEIGRVRVGKIEKKGKMNRRINIHFDA